MKNLILSIKSFLLTDLGKITWQRTKDFIVEQLKGAAFKAALLKFFGTTAGLGVKGWIVKQILENFSDDLGEPIVRGMLTQGGYYYDKINGKMDIREMREAEQAGDSDGYDDAVDDIYS